MRADGGAVAAFKCMQWIQGCEGLLQPVMTHSSTKGPNRGSAVSKQKNQGPWRQLSVPRNNKLTGNASALEISTPNIQHSTIASRLRDIRSISFRSEIDDTCPERKSAHTLSFHKPTRTASCDGRRSFNRRETIETSNIRLAAPWTSSLYLDCHRPSRIFLPEPSCRCLRARLGYPAPLHRPRSRLDPSRP